MKIYIGFLVLGCWWLGGCVNLKTVNTFSQSATISLQKGSRLPTTFTEVYRQRVLEDSLTRHPFNQIPVVGIDFSNQVRPWPAGQPARAVDSLRSYQLADSLAKNGTDLLINYFQTLADLSATGRSFVSPKLKSPTFESFLQNSAIRLTPDQVVAFNRIVNVVVAAATGAYRRRELIDLLEQSHNDVGQLITVLSFAHQRLADVVDISRDQRYGYYKNLLIQDPTLTYVQKYELAKQWLKTAEDIAQTRQAILTHAKTLKTIYEGYATLYLHRDELDSRALVTDIIAYTSLLQQLQTDLEQLRPVYGRPNP